MALQIQCPKMRTTIGEVSFPVMGYPSGWRTQTQVSFVGSNRALNSRILALSGGDGSGSNKKAAAPNSNYVVPFDKSSCITRPLVEILRDLNKRMPDNIIKTNDDHSTSIPWYQANRMLSFYAPGKLLAQPQFELCVDEATQVWTFLNGGWCGEIRDVIFSENGSVTVVYRVTVRGSDGEAHRESTGTVLSGNGSIIDPVAAAEEIAFCRACARFGLGLYLYHED